MSISIGLRSDVDDHHGHMPTRNSLHHAFKRSGAAYRCGHNLLEKGDVR
jgi:hypothetical protein